MNCKFISRLCAGALVVVLLSSCSATKKIIIPEDEVAVVPRELAVELLNDINNDSKNCTFYENGIEFQGNFYKYDEGKFYYDGINSSAYSGFSWTIWVFQTTAGFFKWQCDIVRDKKNGGKSYSEIREVISALRSLGMVQY